MPNRIAIIVNKTRGKFGFSETFLETHIKRMPGVVFPVLGNPGHRRVTTPPDRYLLPRGLIASGARWVSRQIRSSTLHDQDIHSLSRFLREEHIDVVLAEYGPTAVSVMEATEREGVPLVAHFHGFDAYSHYYLQRFAREYERLFSVASRIIAVSKHMQEQLISLGAPPHRTLHNPCGAEVPSSMKAHPASANRLFIMVGRLVEKKSPLRSLGAFRRVLEHFPDAQLDVIGDGDLKADCQAQCEAWGIAGSVSFRGAQPHQEVLKSLATARCFIQHSVRAPNGDHEGTPVGVLEAMGMGLPVVATRHGGIMDVIEEELTGSLVDEGDVEGMAMAMLKYAGDPELARAVGERARVAVELNWTAEKSVQRLSEILTRVVEEN